MGSTYLVLGKKRYRKREKHASIESVTVLRYCLMTKQLPSRSQDVPLPRPREVLDENPNPKEIHSGYEIE